MSRYKRLSFVLFGHFLFNQTINNFILDIPVKLITFNQKRRVVIMEILINVSFLFTSFSFKINKNIHFFHDILVNSFFILKIEARALLNIKEIRKSLFTSFSFYSFFYLSIQRKIILQTFFHDILVNLFFL